VDIVKQVSWAIEHGKFEYCGDQLKVLAEKLHVRNKDIRTAESSTAGWDTVLQYKCNPVAKDSDDKAKINKVENRALKRKRSSSKGRGARDIVHPVGPSFQQPYSSVQSRMSGRGRYFRHSFAPVLPYGYGSTFAYGTGSGIYGGPVTPGPCFHCGENTHFRKDCPRAQSSAASGFGQQVVVKFL
jgi:hypothetical protein